MNQLAVFILFLFFSNTQDTHFARTGAAAAIDTVKTVNAIKVQYAAIDAKRKLYAQYMPAEMPPADAAEKLLVIGYYDGNVLKMINTNFYTNNGKTESDGYLNETGVIFIYAKVTEYMSPLSVDPKGNVKSMKENWYYFNNEELIKWVCAGKVMPAGSEEFIKKKEAFKDEFKKNKKTLSDISTLRKIK